jgi:hypothetical protein
MRGAISRKNPQKFEKPMEFQGAHGHAGSVIRDHHLLRIFVAKSFGRKSSPG